MNMSRYKKIFLIISLILMFIMIANNTVLGFENFSTDIMQDLGNDSGIESANKAVNRIWGTVTLILQMLAVAAIILAGVRYMFASADGKADIKKQTVGLVVGAVLVFGASMVVDFVVNVTKEITDGNVTSSSTHSSSSSSTNSSASNSSSKLPSTSSYNIIPTELSVNMKIGDNTNVAPTIQPEIDKNTSIIYSSSDSNVATVHANGIVTAKGIGKANIYVKVGNLDKVLISTVTVQQKEIFVEEITLKEKEVMIKVGESYTITPTINPSNATNKNVVYSSSDNSIVTVNSDGKITGKSGGTATITIKSESSNKSTSLTLKIVESHKIHFLKTSDSSDCILLESNGRYALIDTGRYSDGDVIKEYFEKMNITKLDFLILTHNHKDHVGAAAKVIQEYKPDKLYLKRYYGNDGEDQASIAKQFERYNTYIAMANAVGTNIVYVEDYGDEYTINLNKMVIKNYNTVNCMADDYVFLNKKIQEEKKNKNVSENANSITTLVTVNGLKTYLTGDLIYDEFGDKIAQMIGKVDVYKIAHHGLANGTSETEANYLRPDYAVATIKRDTLATFSPNAIYRVEKYTKDHKIYYSGDNAIVIDYTSGKVQLIEIK